MSRKATEQYHSHRNVDSDFKNDDLSKCWTENSTNRMTVKQKGWKNDQTELCNHRKYKINSVDKIKSVFIFNWNREKKFKMEKMCVNSCWMRFNFWKIKIGKKIEYFFFVWNKLVSFTKVANASTRPNDATRSGYVGNLPTSTECKVNNDKDTAVSVWNEWIFLKNLKFWWKSDFFLKTWWKTVLQNFSFVVKNCDFFYLNFQLWTVLLIFDSFLSPKIPETPQAHDVHRVIHRTVDDVHRPIRIIRIVSHRMRLVVRRQVRSHYQSHQCCQPLLLHCYHHNQRQWPLIWALLQLLHNKIVCCSVVMRWALDVMHRRHFCHCNRPLAVIHRFSISVQNVNHKILTIWIAIYR